MECPKCSMEMKGQGASFYCENCNIKYKIKFYCEKCGSEPQEISSCGAVSYFCGPCNQLKSRRTMSKEFIEV